MTHEEKIQWMALWCARNSLRLELQGEVGFGRECVGVIHGESYPDWRWYNEDYTECLSDKINGEIFRPEDAYHKHDCVAVLGRGEKAEAQLYDWLKWFDDNVFVLDHGLHKKMPIGGALAILMGQHRYARMVKAKKPEASPQEMSAAYEAARAYALEEGPAPSPRQMGLLLLDVNPKPAMPIVLGMDLASGPDQSVVHDAKGQVVR